MNGPLLIASNHPNSFLDAIIVATLFRNPVYSLARGDAFKGKFIAKILASFNMLPVYRVSEGVENLENNYSTFIDCQDLFRENKIVLIFSEGRCINEWHLRPLKKGTARLALNAWQENIDLKVLPLGINYSNFRSFGKNLILNFGNIISRETIHSDLSSGKAIIEFNQKLREELEKLVAEIDKKDKEGLKKYFYLSQSALKKIILFIPAIAGFLFHFPLYYLVHLSIKNKASDHYDSIMIGLLFFIYPSYVLLITAIVYFITHSIISLWLLLITPVSALCVLHFKNK